MTDLKNYLQTILEMRKSHGMVLRDTEYAYGCLEEFFLDRGRTMIQPALWRPLELEFIKRLKKRFKFKKKECYQNAQQVVCDACLITTPDGRSLSYVEGYALREGLIPLGHAWLLVNGLVWDPTFDLFKDGRTVDYFGVELKHQDVLRHTVEAETWSPLIDDWEQGWPYLRKNGR